MKLATTNHVVGFNSPSITAMNETIGAMVASGPKMKNGAPTKLAVVT
jgi:hypothetical protein